MRKAQSLRAIAWVLVGVLLASAGNAADLIIADSQLDAFEQSLNQHPDEFAGLTVDPERRRIIVRQVGGSRDKRMRAAFAALPRLAAEPDDRSWTVTTQTVTHSDRELKSVRSRLLMTEPFATMVKPVLARHHIDVGRNVVAVGVTAISDELFAAAQSAFGNSVELYITERMKLLSRTNWLEFGIVAAGTRITADSFFGPQTCTTSFSVRPTDGSAYRGFLTAGHCLFGAPMFSDIRDASGNYIAPSIFWHLGAAHPDGVTSSWTYGTDAALVLDNFFGWQTFWAYPQAYTGISVTRQFVVGTRSVREGDTVCLSGSMTGENCSARIKSVGNSSWFIVDWGQQQELTDLIEVEATNGNNVARAGDSGGPVYVRTYIGSNPVLRAVGLINIGAENGSTQAMFQPLSKVMPSGWKIWAARCTQSKSGGLSCSTN